MCMLTNENLSLAEDGIWWIRSSRKKTGVDFEIPLMELPFHIIEKYRDMAPEGKASPHVFQQFVEPLFETDRRTLWHRTLAGLPRGPSYLCDRNYTFPWRTA